jgi:c-di-AMP phosphodiesterase-like protein
MILGNYTLLMQAAVLLILYFILNILWFSFKSKKHFLIGLITFIILILILWVSENYTAQKRSSAYDVCVKEGFKSENSENFKGGVMNCMKAKGYLYYR